jgi:hypothetical protein
MKLNGWEKVGSADEYREMIQAEYLRLKHERLESGQSTGLEEVKLRLFLSLLERPVRSLHDEDEVHDQLREDQRPAA